MSLTAQLTKDDKKVLYIVALVWGVDMLYYLKAVVMRLPVINLLSDIFVPSVVVISLLVTFSSLCKRFRGSDYIFYVACIVVYLLTYVLFPANELWLDKFLPIVWFQTLPYFFVGLLVDPKRQMRVVEVVSLVSIVFSILYLSITLNTRNVEGEEMGAAYSLLPHLLVVLYSCIRNFKWYSLVIFLVGLFRLLGTGNRGTLLCIAFFLVFYLLIAERSKHRLLVITVIALIGLFVWFNQYAVFGFLNDSLEGLGFNTRVFDMALEGALSDANGRDVLAAFFVDKISSGGLLGYGVLGDRALQNAEDGYPHNLALEIWVDFGILLGTILLLALLVLLFKAFKANNDKESKGMLAVLTTAGIFSLFLSNSYMTNPLFFMTIGYAINIARKPQNTSCYGQKNIQIHN